MPAIAGDSTEAGESLKAASGVSSRTHIVLLAAGLAALALILLPLAAYAYNAHFNRYLADDYCVAAHIDRRGLWGAQVAWYTLWTGRYGAIFAGDSLAFLGKDAFAWYVPLFMLAWFACIAFTGYELGRLLFGRKLLLPATLLAAVLLFAFVGLHPEPQLGFFWVSGNTSHTLPLLLLTLNAGLVVRAAATPGSSLMVAGLVVFVLGFLSSGFAETFIVWQLSLMTLALALLWRFAAGDTGQLLLKLLPCALLGAVFGAAVVFFAPGNDVRAQESVQASLPQAAFHSAKDAAWLLKETVPRPETVLVAGVALIVTALLIARMAPRRHLGLHEAIIRLALGSCACFGLIFLSLAPAHYIVSGVPGRALGSGVLTVLLLAAYAGYIGGRVLGERLSLQESPARLLDRYAPSAVVVATVLVAAIALPPAMREFERSDEGAAYARCWDKRDRQLEALGGRSSVKARPTLDFTPKVPQQVRVAYLPHASGFELTPNPELRSTAARLSTTASAALWPSGGMQPGRVETAPYTPLQ